jgi:hypothetical protein
MYVTTGKEALPTALAEFFSGGGDTVGPIERARGVATLSAFSVTKALRLLRLDGGWVTRAGGNQAICSGDRARSREWARLIYETHSDVAGLYYRSSIYGPGRCLTLWERAEPALPVRPDASRLLADPALAPALATAAEHLGTVVVV